MIKNILYIYIYFLIIKFKIIYILKFEIYTTKNIKNEIIQFLYGRSNSIYILNRNVNRARFRARIRAILIS